MVLSIILATQGRALFGEFIMPQLDKVAKQFDCWMKSFEDSHREHGHLDDNNKALVDFLNNDSGFDYVKTYEELCELAVMLQEKGYKTTNPPCELIDFARAIERAHPRSFGDSKPVIPESVSNKKLNDYISRRVNEIEAIEDPQMKIGESAALGLIDNSIFKTPRFQAASSENEASVAEQEQKGYQSPSLTHSGHDVD